jgi:two-component system chemotaxis response regulator CheB
MSGHDIIVIGASAGGVEALARLVGDLPADIPAAIFITVHFPRHGTSALPQILTRAGALEARHAGDGEPIERGRIYVAPPDHHLLLLPTRLRLVRGPTENGNRPAADPMFRTAALAFGPRVVGVVMSGNLDDGTGGLLTIKRHGGIAVVQDPTDAMFPSMPMSAIEHVAVDHVVPLVEMANVLERVATTPVVATRAAEEGMSSNEERELSLSEMASESMGDERHTGERSPYGCPDCGGVLFRIRDEELMRYRCRTGHGWTSDALLLAQSHTLDDALWTALRALEESASLSEALARRARARANERSALRHEETLAETRRRARLIRDVLIRGNAVPQGDEDENDECTADPPARGALRDSGAGRHRAGG